MSVNYLEFWNKQLNPALHNFGDSLIQLTSNTEDNLEEKNKLKNKMNIPYYQMLMERQLQDQSGLYDPQYLKYLNWVNSQQSQQNLSNNLTNS